MISSLKKKERRVAERTIEESLMMAVDQTSKMAEKTNELKKLHNLPSINLDDIEIEVNESKHKLKKTRVKNGQESKENREVQFHI